MDRRTFIAAGLASAAFPAMAASGRDDAAVLLRRIAPINGNLVFPVDPDKPLDAEVAAQIRASGLAAIKFTLGGSGNRTAAETAAEIAEVDRAIALNPDLLLRIREFADIARAKASGRMGVILSFEAGEMLEGRVESIDRFRDLGIRVMGLSYNLDTPFASGLMSKAHGGLTDLGRAAIDRMNARGVAIDLSHSDEPSTLAAIGVSNRPVMVTHAGCAAVHANPRNKSDVLLRALADRGGVIGIFELSYLTAAPKQPTLDIYMAHLEHALRVCGEESIGIGSDALLTPFDTSPESMKAWNAETARRKATGVAAPGEGPPPFVVGLNRPDRFRVIAETMLRRGHPPRRVEKVLGGNFARVFAATWI